MWSKRGLILLLILFLGGFFRFCKLDWGGGYFFHPDEYHIAAAVERLSFPKHLNPQLFSYGSVIVYLIYFTRLFFSLISAQFLKLNPILLGRFYAALFSTLTIIFWYLITRLLIKDKSLAYLTALLVATTPGLIQQAHFATPESVLIFFISLFLYGLISWQKKSQNRFLYLAAVSLGLALGTKIVALIFLPVLILSSLMKTISSFSFKSVIKTIFIPLFLVMLVYIFVSPYAFLDFSHFRSSMNYEIGVGRGAPLVFYTRQFINTIPFQFQLEKIFPYALGLPLLFLGILGLSKLILEPTDSLWLLIAFAFYFIFNASLFAKWTRFMAPVFPFFAFFAVYFLSGLKKHWFFRAGLFLVSLNFIWTVVFFSLYLRPDIRLVANNWVKQNLPAESTFFTEQGNMIEVPMQAENKKISLDFYSLDDNSETQELLPAYLAQADYFIIQSRRIFSNHQRLPQQFPLTARFYNLLFSGGLGFQKIKEFNPWSPLPFSDEQAEETWSVFDHPVIRIYQKNRPLSQEDYETLLKI
jgi:hypothetical protein